LAFVAPGLTTAQDKAYVLEGLRQSAEILRDKWGVPHIYADTQDDMFFAQGFNAARDRLWQLDLWRRQGEGSSPSSSVHALSIRIAPRAFSCIAATCSGNSKAITPRQADPDRVRERHQCVCRHGPRQPGAIATRVSAHRHEARPLEARVIAH